MGFGFNFLLILIVFPLTVILAVLWLITQKAEFGKLLAGMWGLLFLFCFVVGGINYLNSKKKLEKHHYYGDYIIDRNYFKGEQADWQYNSFRFSISREDSIYFHITEGERIIQTITGAITTVEPYNSHRLKIRMNEPGHHILSSNPTTYRQPWSFYLVFYSPRFNNMFFTKGKWKPIN